MAWQPEPNRDVWLECMCTRMCRASNAKRYADTTTSMLPLKKHKCLSKNAQNALPLHQTLCHSTANYCTGGTFSTGGTLTAPKRKCTACPAGSSTPPGTTGATSPLNCSGRRVVYARTYAQGNLLEWEHLAAARRKKAIACNPLQRVERREMPGTHGSGRIMLQQVATPASLSSCGPGLQSRRRACIRSLVSQTHRQQAQPACLARAAPTAQPVRPAPGVRAAQRPSPRCAARLPQAQHNCRAQQRDGCNGQHGLLRLGGAAGPLVAGMDQATEQRALPACPAVTILDARGCTRLAPAAQVRHQCLPDTLSWWREAAGQLANGMLAC